MLDSLLRALPDRPATFYIHDTALMPALRGTGAARAKIQTIAERASALGLPTLSLATIEEAADFWRASEFLETPVSTTAQGALRSYGKNARFMTRPVDASARNA